MRFVEPQDSWGSHGPTSRACPGPSGWHPIPQAWVIAQGGQQQDWVAAAEVWWHWLANEIRTRPTGEFKFH